ncbi:MAG: hypothetical protein GX446_04105 [Chthonomonadales bacterium]|nr:hypothetical protein [Chthonomonadales bacterium]
MLYLSVHDLVWLNARICGEEQPFNYELLEEAVAAQYGYGDSTDVLGQGSDFVVALAHGRPFASGNLRTALVALCVYLQGNGYTVRAPGDPARADVGRMLLDIGDGRADGSAIVEALAGETGEIPWRHAPTVTGSNQIVMNRASVVQTIEREAALLSELAPDDGPIPGRVFVRALHRD